MVVSYVSARAPPQGRLNAGETRWDNNDVYCFSRNDYNGNSENRWWRITVFTVLA